MPSSWVWKFGDLAKSNSAPGLSSGYLAGTDADRRNQLGAWKDQNVAVSSAPEAVMAAPES